MPIPTTIESLSTTAASNSPSGSEQRTLADDGLRQAYAFIKQVVSQGSDIASASTITPASTGYQFDVTGTTSITTIASTNSWDGRLIALQFDGALTLTHSSTLYLPGAANITTAAGDVALFLQRGSGSWQCISYSRKSDNVTVHGTLTVNGNTTLGNAGTDTVTTNGNVTINAPSSGAALAINAATGYDGITIDTSSAAAESKISFYRNAVLKTLIANIGTAGNIINGSLQGDLALRTASGQFLFSVDSGTTTNLKIGTAGNVTVNAPSSGHSLTLENSASSGVTTTQLYLHDTGANSTRMAVAVTNTDIYFVAGGSSADPAYVWRNNDGTKTHLKLSSTGKLTLTPDVVAGLYALNIPTKTPSSASDTGTQGDISWDSSYLYVCTASNTWKRAAISTW